jgi:hypothetical protein
MKNILFAATRLIIALAVACSGAATSIPSPAPTQTSTPQISTPMPTREWDIKGVSVETDTVTVSLHVFAGIAVRESLDGKRPSRVEEDIPTLEFVFEGVAPGEHDIEIKDVVGHSETTSVMVEELTPGGAIPPQWLAEWVSSLDAGEVEFPPQSITRYQWQGETVYYVVMQCCDQFSDLLDFDGNLIGHPDGGIAGRGDGVTVFSPTGLKGFEVWPVP